jgi:hypothetical protein
VPEEHLCNTLNRMSELPGLFGLVAHGAARVQNAGLFAQYEHHPALIWRSVIPGYRGCLIFVSGRHTDVTAVFTFSFERKIQVQVLGEETFSFGGSRGIGYSGSFAPLQRQL